MPWIEAGIALGSNLGDKAANIAFGIDRLCDGKWVRLLARSTLHRTEPWGPIAQDWFLNAAALVETRLDPPMLLTRAKAVERAAGRRPGPRYGPRELDIDLLWVGEAEIDTPDLRLPHPGLFSRAFVLAPLAEIAADRVVAGRRIAEVARALLAEGYVGQESPAALRTSSRT